MKTQKLAIVSKSGLIIINVKNKECETFTNDGSTIQDSNFDNSGRYFCYCSISRTILLDLENEEKIELNSSSKFSKVSFSPNGNYLALYSPNYRNSTNDNVFCVKTSDRSKVIKFRCSNLLNWAPQWSSDEKLMFLVQNNNIILYQSDNIGNSNGRMTLKGLETASVEIRGHQYLIAVHVLGSNDMPDMVKIFQYPNLNQSINNRSFFRGNDVVTLHWSPNGKSLLFMLHTTEILKNYHGQKSLYFMSSDLEGDTCIVEMPNAESKVHGFDWHPLSGDRFIVTYGSPSMAAVFDGKCKLLYKIDAPGRNVCEFSHCGTSVAMMEAGMKSFEMIIAGNVRHSIQLWNLETRKLFGELDIDDVNRIAWSGDDKYMVTATVSPAIRNNNGFVIWSLDGDIIADKTVCDKMIGEATELYKVFWQPDPSSLVDHRQCNYSGRFSYDDKYQKIEQKIKPPSVPKTVGNKENIVQDSPNMIVTVDSSTREKTKKKRKKKKNNARKIE